MKNGYSKKVAWILVGAGVVVLFGFIALLGLNGYMSGTALNLEWTAQAGTFVGGTVGALWALAGVFFFYAALQLQEQSLDKMSQSLEKQETALDLQKDELEYLRKEYKLQRQEMEMTRKVFETQTFETTFFNLIKQKNVAEQRSFGDGANKKLCIDHVLSILNPNFISSQMNNPMPTTEEYQYRMVKPYIHAVEILLEFTGRKGWGEKIIKGQTKAIDVAIQNAKKHIKSGKSDMMKFFGISVSTPDQKVRDEKAYGSIIAGTTSPEARVLFFFYVFTCNSTYKDLALSLGFFEGLPVSAFPAAWNYDLAESLEENNGLLCSRSNFA